ncbi:hypothetical protein TNIN_495311, partial [Trichonephila inaurata madagascariensis]
GRTEEAAMESAVDANIDRRGTGWVNLGSVRGSPNGRTKFEPGTTETTVIKGTKQVKR